MRRRLLSLALAGVAARVFAGPPLQTAENHSPHALPTRTATVDSTVKIDGIEYVDTFDLAKRFGLKPSWLKKDERLALQNATWQIELGAESRETRLGGLRVFLGDPVHLYRHSLYVSRVDVDKLLTPLLRQGAGEGRVPELKVIAIDAGHGGKDPGKENHTLHVNEKTFTLDVATRLRKLLEAQGYRTVMTRVDDRAVELEQRPEIATRASADLFISIHFNAVEKDVARVSGTETYTMTPQHQRSSGDNQGKVNDSSTDPALTNPGNVNDPWNALLGYIMHRELTGDLKTFDRGMKRARYKVLRLSTCPAVLLESAYLSNDTEARKVSTPAFRQEIAAAIAGGVKAYAAALATASANTEAKR